MIKPFTCNQTVHSWPDRPPVTKPFTHNCSSVNKNNNNTPGASILWYFLEPLSDCDISLGLSMTLTLPGASLWLWNFLGPLYDCETSLGLSMIVKLPWASLWLWNFLGPLYDCGTSWGRFIIVTFNFIIVTPPYYDCETSWVLLMIMILPAASYWLWHFLMPLWLSHFLEPLYNYCGRKSVLCFDSQCLKISFNWTDFWINWFGRIWGNPILLIKIIFYERHTDTLGEVS